MKMRIADALLEVMRENNMTGIDIGDFGILDQAYERAYGPSGSGARTRNPHPMNRHQAVMDAVRRSPKFRELYR